MAINPWDIFGVAVALMLLGIVLFYHPKPRKFQIPPDLVVNL
jgi:hypothetical protein